MNDVEGLIGSFVIAWAILTVVVSNYLGHIRKFISKAYHNVNDNWTTYLGYDRRYGRKCPVCGYAETRSSLKASWETKVGYVSYKKCSLIVGAITILLFFVTLVTMMFLLYEL